MPASNTITLGMIEQHQEVEHHLQKSLSAARHIALVSHAVLGCAVLRWADCAPHDNHGSICPSCAGEGH
jgi:hypothetical protein